MVILVCKKNTQDLEIISFSLESKFGATTLKASGFQQAIEFLLDDVTIDLVICDYSLENMKLFKFLLSLGGPVPFILFRDSNETLPKGLPGLSVLGYVEVDEGLSAIEVIINEALKDKRLLSATEVHGDYCRIKTALLLKTVPLYADVYIRLSSIKFIKIFNKGEVFDEKDLSRILEKKQIEYLYIKNFETEAFIHKFQKDLSRVVENSSNLSAKDTAGLTVAIHDAANELAQSLGFTEQVQGIVNHNVVLTIQSFQQNPSHREYLKFLKENKEKYTNVHSILLSRVACALAFKMSWSSTATLSKLAVAAMIHDVSLRNDKLAAIDTIDEISARKDEFSEAEIEAFKGHPKKAAEMVQACKDFPGGIDTVLAEHHERPDGKGFPRGIGALQINPLSCVFILAHVLVDEIIRKGTDVSIESFVAENKWRFNKGHFKYIFQALEDGTPYNPEGIAAA